MHHGYLPVIVDHADGDRFNNRQENLQAATKSQNSSHSRRKPGKSKHLGIYKQPGVDKYRVGIMHNNKPIHLGMFSNITDAIEARLEAEKKYFGKYAPIRNPKNNK